MMREAEQLAHFGSWQVDLVTGKHKWSDETYRIFGYEPGGLQVTDETFLDHIHEEDRPVVKNAIDEAVLRHDSHPCEFRIKDKFGKIKHILSSILVKRDHKKKPIQLSGFDLDITHQKRQNEELALQNKQLIEIAWIQSHEVRGPLARIMGLINLVEGQQGKEANVKELLKPILDSAYELDQIIRKIVKKTEAIEPKITS